MLRYTARTSESMSANYRFQFIIQFVVSGNKALHLCAHIYSLKCIND